MAVLLGGAFVAILNQTLMVPAIPVIMNEFHIAANTGQWLTTIFMLTNGIMIPVTAFFMGKYSTRKLFFTSMGLFMVGTLFAAAASNFGFLLVGRIVQASGAGIMIPLMQTVLLTIIPFERRGAAMGIVGLVISFAPAIGPALGGWLVEYYSWRLLLYIVLPIAILDMILAIFTLHNVIELTHPRVDVASIVFSSLGFGGLLYGFSTAGSGGWVGGEVVASLGVGALSLTIFVYRQLKMKTPMLEFRIFRHRMFTISTVISMVVFMSIIAAEVILPIYLQTMRGYSALDTGLLLFPGAVVMGVVSPFAGRLFDQYGVKWLAISGLMVLTVSTLPLTILTTNTSYTYLTIVYTARLLGITLVMMPVTTAGLNQLPLRLIAHGTAMNNTMRQVAASIGPAVLVTVMTSGLTEAEQVINTQAMIHGTNRAFLVATCISFFALVLSFFLKRGNQCEEGQ